MRSLTSTPGEIELLRILEIQRRKKYKKIFRNMSKRGREALYLYSLFPTWMFRVEEDSIEYPYKIPYGYSAVEETLSKKDARNLVKLLEKDIQ